MSSDSANDPRDASRDKKPDPSPLSDSSASLESELWNLDDEESSRPMPAELLGAVGEDIPPAKLSRAPRIVSASFTEKKNPQVQSAPTKQEDHYIKLNVKRNHDIRPAERPTRRVDFLREFGDLEQWADDGGKSTGREVDEAKNLAKMEGAVASEEPVLHEAPMVDEPVEQVSVLASNEPEASEAEQAPVTSKEVAQAVASPVAKSKSHVKFSVLEKFGMIALVVLLLGAVGNFDLFGDAFAGGDDEFEGGEISGQR